MNFFTSTEELTFGALGDWWLENHAEKRLEERTLERYYQYRTRAFAALGNILVKDIKVLDIQLFINSLGEKGVNQRTGGALSPKTIRGYMNFISDIMRFAWRLEIIEVNPCQRVELPPLVKKEPVIYTEKQTCEFLFYLLEAPLKYQVFYNVVIFAGLRRGELLGLNWTDIDFDNCIMLVRRNSQYTKRKGLYCKTPKTPTGRRTLKLPEMLFTSLRRLKKEQIAQCRREGVSWSENTRLFTGTTGRPMHPNTPYNWLKRFCHNRDIPFYGIHQFRHLNASLLICTGADPTTVSHALGHSAVSVTMNTYSHAFAYEQAKASDAIGQLIAHRISAFAPSVSF